MLERERTLHLLEIEGYRIRRERLTLKAGAAGVITQIDTYLAAGQWVGSTQRLVHMARTDAAVARAVVREQDVARLDTGAHGVFIADDANLRSVDVLLKTIGAGTSATRELKLLASMYGGPVDAEPDANGTPKTTAAMFPVQFQAAQVDQHMRDWPREVRGVVVAQGQRKSIAERIAARMAAVLLREAGF